VSIDDDNRARAIEIGAFAYYWGAKSEGKVDPETLSIALDAFEEGGEDAADDFLEDYTFDVPDTYARSEEWEPDAWVKTDELEEGVSSPHNRAMSYGYKEPNEYYGPHTPLLIIPSTSDHHEQDAVARSNAGVIDAWIEEDETDFLDQFLVTPSGVGIGDYYLRLDLGPLPTQLAEAIGSLENYVILDEEALTELEQTDEAAAWDDWAAWEWRNALESEHSDQDIEITIDELDNDQLYTLYRQAAEETNTPVQHLQTGVYFGDFDDLAGVVSVDDIEGVAGE
jgi:hypothetical protein